MWLLFIYFLTILIFIFIMNLFAKRNGLEVEWFRLILYSIVWPFWLIVFICLKLFNTLYECLSDFYITKNCK